LGNPFSLCHDERCRRLADALIAIEGNRLAEFAANNDKEWVLLAGVMGKPLLNPVRAAREARGETHPD
jgi:hypothetical protein